MIGLRLPAVAAGVLLAVMTAAHAQTNTQSLGNAAGGEGAQYGPLGAAESSAGGTGKSPTHLGTTGSNAGEPPSQAPATNRPGASTGDAQRLNRISPGAGAPSEPARAAVPPQRGASDARLGGARPNRLDIAQPNRFDDK